MPNPIDYTTTRFNTGVSYLAASWMTDISYNYSEFDNEETLLNWQDPFTFDEKIYGLAPDNKFHQLAVKLRYRNDKTQYSATGHYSQSKQDEKFIPGSVTTPVSC